MELSQELYNRVHERFEKILEDNPRIDELMQKALRKQASYADSHEYGRLIGEALREAMNSVTGKYLPEGKMPMDIADRLLGDHLRECDETMRAYCEAVQKGMNDTYKIGVKPIAPPSRENTVAAVVKKVTEVETYSPEALDGIIDFTTWSLETADQYMKANADFLTRSGVQMLIMRTYEGPHWDPHRGKGGSMQNCTFCMERATDGWEPYAGSAEQEIYRRHRGCRCMVVTKFSDKLNTAWTGKTGQDMQEIYMQERERLRKLDSMDYIERYNDLKAQKRARDRGRRRQSRNRRYNRLDESE